MIDPIHKESLKQSCFITYDHYAIQIHVHSTDILMKFFISENWIWNLCGSHWIYSLLQLILFSFDILQLLFQFFHFSLSRKTEYRKWTSLQIKNMFWKSIKIWTHVLHKILMLVKPYNSIHFICSTN